MDTTLDAVIIGGGFYGATIAVYLAKQRGLKKVMLIEQEPALLQHASYHNQARVHNGYHYPRSFTTAYRSRINLPKFISDFPETIKQEFTKIYAIARRNSKITSLQFKRFCKEIGAKTQNPEPILRSIFNKELIEDVFLVEEYAFDAKKLGIRVIKELNEANVAISLGTRASALWRGPNKTLQTSVKLKNGVEELLTSRFVFNCTYSGLNQLSGHFRGTSLALKQEITEMALMEMPSELKNLGITVMDGPFFSIMPFPERNLHTLSHVRYTPHHHWLDQKGIDPYRRLIDTPRDSRVERMIRDVEGNLPSIFSAKYRDSLFEIKTVLVKNETDDGRPILFEKHVELPGCFSVLGGKIDNVYDVLEKLDTERFEPIQSQEFDGGLGYV